MNINHKADELFMQRPFSHEEVKEIQEKLNRKLDPSDISYRSNGAAGTLAYLEGWRAISHANECFGFNGWSSSIQFLTTDYCDLSPDGTRVSVGMSCTVRVWLRDGTFHEDVGYGIADGMKGKGVAFEKARKEAVTDATKRALRSFGDRLGNCAYDKEFLKNLKRVSQSQHSNHHLQQQQQKSHLHKENTSNESSSMAAPADFVPKWTNARTLSSDTINHSHNQHQQSNHPPSDFTYEDFPMFEG